MGQSGVRPIGNLFWDIGLIASYLLYWSLVIYPMTSDELKYARIVYYLMVGMVLVLVLGVLYCIVQLATVEVAVGQLVHLNIVCYVQECVTASFGQALAELRHVRPRLATAILFSLSLSFPAPVKKGDLSAFKLVSDLESLDLG